MNIISVFEILGVISFAMSGVLRGMRKRLDIFGVGIIACITATGGGILRDLFMGRIPPVAFRDYRYIFISFLVTIAVFIYYNYIPKKLSDRIINKYMALMELFDAIGLGIFTVSSISIAQSIYPTNQFLCLTVGIFTGVGGGVMRDVITGQIPLVFKKELYAVPAIIGGILYLFLSKYFYYNLCMYICATVILVIRLLAIKYNICLPIIKNKSAK